MASGRCPRPPPPVAIVCEGVFKNNNKNPHLNPHPRPRAPPIPAIPSAPTAPRLTRRLSLELTSALQLSWQQHRLLSPERRPSPWQSHHGGRSPIAHPAAAHNGTTDPTTATAGQSDGGSGAAAAAGTAATVCRAVCDVPERNQRQPARTGSSGHPRGGGLQPPAPIEAAPTAKRRHVGACTIDAPTAVLEAGRATASAGRGLRCTGGPIKPASTPPARESATATARLDLHAELS